MDVTLHVKGITQLSSDCLLYLKLISWPCKIMFEWVACQQAAVSTISQTFDVCHSMNAMLGFSKESATPHKCH